MWSHEKIRSILEKSEKIKSYDAIGIITIVMLIGLIVDGITILKFCTSSKGTALIIKNGGPLVRMFARRNLYNYQYMKLAVYKKRSCLSIQQFLHCYQVLRGIRQLNFV